MSGGAQFLLASMWVTSVVILVLLFIVEARTDRIQSEIRDLRAQLKETQQTGRNLWNHIEPGGRP